MFYFVFVLFKKIKKNPPGRQPGHPRPSQRRTPPLPAWPKPAGPLGQQASRARPAQLHPTPSPLSPSR